MSIGPNKIFKFFIFIIAFQINVKLKASNVLFQNPEGCADRREMPCTLEPLFEPYKFQIKNSTFFQGQGSVLNYSETDKWQFLRGALWIRKSKNEEIKTLYGKLKGPQTDVWLFVEKDRVLLRNSGREVLRFEARDGQILELPTGFQTWVGGINREGQNAKGMIQPIPIKDHVRQVSRMLRGNKEEIAALLEDQKIYWGSPVELSSQIYKDHALRRLASIENQQKLREKAEIKENNLRQKTRRLLLQRVLEK